MRGDPCQQEQLNGTTLKRASVLFQAMRAKTSLCTSPPSPAGVTALKPGTKLDFGIVDGRRGKQALTVTIVSEPASVVKGHRKKADDLAVIMEDLIKLLDSVSNQLRNGKYPADALAQKTASVLRAVADDLDI